MKAKQAMNKSNHGVSVNVKEIGEAIIIFTANKSWNNNIKYKNIVFREGSFSTSGDLSPEDNKIPLEGWIPIENILELK